MELLASGIRESGVEVDTVHVSMDAKIAALREFHKEVLSTEHSHIIVRHVPSLALSVGVLLAIQKMRNVRCHLLVATPVIRTFQETYMSDSSLATKVVQICAKILGHPFVFFAADRIIEFAEESRILAAGTRNKRIRISHPVDLAPMSAVNRQWQQKDSEGPVRLIGASQGPYHHGYRRLILGLALSDAATRSELHWDIFGPHEAFRKEQSMVLRFGLQDTVSFRGEVSPTQLREEIRGSEQYALGVGVLEPSRRPPGTVSALKHRLYAEVLLPFITSWDDSLARCEAALLVPSDTPYVDVRDVLNWLAGLDAERAVNSYRIVTLEHSASRVGASILQGLGD